MSSSMRCIVIAVGLMLLLSALPASASETGLRLSLSLAETRESLTNNRPDWRDRSVSVGLNRLNRSVAYFGVRDTQRFEQEDRELSAGVVLKPTSTINVLLEGTNSSTHRVLARDALSGQVSMDLGEGWVVGTGLRRSHYEIAGNSGPRTSVSTLSNVSFERYLGSWRFAYTAYLSRATSTPYSSSNRLAISFDPNDDLSIGVSGSRGRELENIPGIGLRASRVTNLSAGIAWSVLARAPNRPGLRLSLDLSEQRQGELYKRRGARVAARLGF